MLVQVNTDSDKKRILFAFTHLTTDKNSSCLTFLFIPATNLGDKTIFDNQATNLVLIDIC
jgi:hypothetical protein